MHETIRIPFQPPFTAMLATPNDNQPHPGLLLIHEVWGLTDHIKDVANRFAAQGYIVLAPDLLSHTGITENIDQNIMAAIHNPETRAEAQKQLRAALTPIQSPTFAEQTVKRLQACIETLLAKKPIQGKIAVVGFCFGGTYSFALAAADNRLCAAVPFYGHAPEPLEKINTISCPILAFYGEQDENLIKNLPKLRTAMQRAGKNFTAYVYPNTGHAFFNDTNAATYNEPAATDAWQKTLAFLAENTKQ